jgi:hypothetical protein
MNYDYSFLINIIIDHYFKLSNFYLSDERNECECDQR